MTLRTRNDPFSPPPDSTPEPETSSGILWILARVLAFLFAAVLSWILYRVITGAYRQWQQNGASSLFDRRRGTYRRVPSLRLHGPEEDEYRDELEVEVDGVGARSGREEEVDEGYHDGESEAGSSKGDANLNVWKELPERPLPDKPLPEVPMGS